MNNGQIYDLMEIGDLLQQENAHHMFDDTKNKKQNSETRF